MILYEYRCKSCGTLVTSTERSSTLGNCPRDLPPCSGELKRFYGSVQLAPVMQEHYNPSLDRHVSDIKQVTDGFKYASDEYSERTGIEARFVPVDPGDSSLGATNAGLEATNARRVRDGLKPVYNVAE